MVKIKNTLLSSRAFARDSSIDSFYLAQNKIKNREKKKIKLKIGILK
jgi:hypothetical protein